MPLSVCCCSSQTGYVLQGVRLTAHANGRNEKTILLDASRFFGTAQRRQDRCYFENNLSVHNIVLQSKQGVKRNRPDMSLAIHAISDVLQGGSDSHRRPVSAAKDVQTFGFCIVCCFYFYRQNSSFEIRNKIYLCFRS